MWHFDYRHMAETGIMQPFDMINSPFAFPRLPPRMTPLKGIAGAGNVKEKIIQDSQTMMSRLSIHHTMFQRYASGLFNMNPIGTVPGHPLQSKMHALESLRQENEQLKKENSILKSDLQKEKKK